MFQKMSTVGHLQVDSEAKKIAPGGDLDERPPVILGLWPEFKNSPKRR